MGSVCPSIWPRFISAAWNVQQVYHLTSNQETTALKLASASLLVLVGAMILDLSMVRFMTPTDISISQADLLSLSLPSLSLSLSVTVNCIAALRRQEPEQHIGASFLEAGVPFNDTGIQLRESFGQRLCEDLAETYRAVAELPTDDILIRG